MSTEHQKYSIDNQSAAIAIYAAAQGIGIVRSFVDSGRSGLSVTGRDALQELLRTVQDGKADFDFILVYDVSRWGRFLDADESAHYEYLCKRSGIQIRYCAEQFENDNSSLANLLKALKRTMAGEYSRELSAKTFAGQCHLFSLGYRMGGMPGFGFRRQLLDQDNHPKQILATGQNKSIQTDRVKLVLGPAHEIALIKRIYYLFTKEQMGEITIMRWLNRRGLFRGPDRPWTLHTLHEVLTNPKYAGTVVRNRTTTKLGSKRSPIPPEVWLYQKNGIESIVSQEQFVTVQKILEGRYVRNSSNEALLQDLRRLLHRKGELSVKLLKRDKNCRCEEIYIRRFGSLHNAFRLAGFEPRHDTSYVETRRRIPEMLKTERQGLIEAFCAAGAEVDSDSSTNLLTVNRQFTVKLVFSLYYRNAGGQWKVKLNKTPVPDVVVLCRLNSNGTLLDYFLLPTEDFAQTIFRVRAKNRPNVDVYRADDMERLIDVARRMPLTTLDDPYVQSDEPKKRSSHKRADRRGEDQRRHHWHVAKTELLLKRIARNADLMQCSVSALRQLLLDENMVNLLRAESLANIPLGLFRQLRRGQFKSAPSRSRAAVEEYGSSALTCTVAIRYLEALLGNANVNRYLRKYHEQILQDLDRVVEESRIPPSNETEADVMKKHMWTLAEK